MTGSGERLRLRAQDEADLAVIAACLQDAFSRPKEMAFLREKSRFMVAFERYRRELEHDPVHCTNLTQTACALSVDLVTAVRTRGVDADRPDQELQLLTIVAEPHDEDGYHMTFFFAGGAAVQLRVPEVAARLEDFGEPWPAKRTPCDHFADPGNWPATPTPGNSP